MGQKSRLSIDTSGDWRRIVPAAPSGHSVLGIVRPVRGEPGVLVQCDATGRYGRLTPKGMEPLDQQEVRIALGLPRPVGKPRAGYELREVYSVRLEPELASYIRDLGDGNLSAGVTKLAERHRERARRRRASKLIDTRTDP